MATSCLGTHRVTTAPAFGQADLTNCERELIHFAGSIQPHGLLFAIREPSLLIEQVSENTSHFLDAPWESYLNRRIGELGPELESTLERLAAAHDLSEPMALRCELRTRGGNEEFEGYVHRCPAGLLLLELEPTHPAHCPPLDLQTAGMIEQLNVAVERLSAASTIGALTETAVRCLRDIIGYDRVMIYKFDPDGHGKIIAEARDPRLGSLLGHHYPASDIPQRARELYLRNRLRVLVDVDYQPAALRPRNVRGTHDELDMSMCYLRSMSPLHLQYLKNMGVTATLVASLVREGRLWGLIACHHYSARNLRMAVRDAADLLAEVISTRIAAIENYAHAQVAIQVRRLEQRLVEATSTEGDWRLALFRNPHTLLQPLDATAAALFYDGEVLTTGEAPSTLELRAVMQWIDQQSFDGLFSCSSVARANSALDSLTPSASGVLAVRLSTSRPEYLMWFRREQLLSVTWAGDPSKPVIGDDPLELSPRRSFAAWSEIVRGTALPWSNGELALARAFGAALIDIIAQVNAVRLLIADHQLARVRSAVENSSEPVVVARADRRTLFASDAFYALTRRSKEEYAGGVELSSLFCDSPLVREMLERLSTDRHSWRGELELKLGEESALPVSVRAEIVPARDGSILGYFLIFTDMRHRQRAEFARRHLEQALAQAMNASPAQEWSRDSTKVDGLVSAILANARLAAMDIADGNASPSVVPLLEELEASTKRATTLYARIRAFGTS